MRIKGIASTRDVDSDQEILEPDGFITDRFLSKGFFNYNHKSSFDPKAIVGEPTAAYVKDGQFWVEGFLYSESTRAQDLYETIQVVHKSSKNRRFGLSIEGRALERDPLNPKRITKALITGCAITPTPKNPSTLLDVIKGDVDPYTEWEYDTKKSEVFDEDGNGGEVQYLIDVTGSDGMRRIVDANFNIKIFRAMDVGAYAPTQPESVAGVRRKGKKRIDPNKLEKTNKKFSKSEAYSEIFATLTSDVKIAKGIYALAQKIKV